MAPVSNLNQLNTFQLILATDLFNSFAIFNYVRLDSAPLGGVCTYAIPDSNSSFTQFTTSLNCTLGVTFVALINAGSNNHTIFED
jgi:hypothetical protein